MVAPSTQLAKLLVRARLRWLTEAEMDEVSAQRRPNGILKEAAPTANIPLACQVRASFVTAIHCSPFA
ncbi:uncharacterized protein AKAME5_000015700 [Lates japonicus]|uniref:Uncharacterized protein n=1 Tax=Lates japonicus TaxID=270547 RepID=A0AAD3M179_LATJO|nr:uncharacterized protein AKAME5_000015700 [Lates japonicus]